jgi:hypothetical protein
MTTVKIKLEDGSVQTIQGDVIQITHKAIPTDKKWVLKTVDVSGVVEAIDFIGGRPDDR